MCRYTYICIHHQKSILSVDFACFDAFLHMFCCGLNITKDLFFPLTSHAMMRFCKCFVVDWTSPEIYSFQWFRMLWCISTHHILYALSRTGSLWAHNRPLQVCVDTLLLLFAFLYCDVQLHRSGACRIAPAGEHTIRGHKTERDRGQVRACWSRETWGSIYIVCAKFVLLNITFCMAGFWNGWLDNSA